MKFVDLGLEYNKYKDKINKRISDITEESAFIFGGCLTELENSLAKYVGVKYAVGVSSGADAIVLSLMAKGLDPKEDNSEKEVIVPSFTFIATAEAVAFLGAKPVFCDIEDKNYNIDASKIEACVTDKTVGIIPVNLFGACSDFDKINDIAKKHNLFVIEDACQSFGAEYNGRKSCSLSDIGTTSFFPAKPLGCFGDGGMVFTDNEDDYEKIKCLRHHGDTGGMNHKYIGMTGRLDNLQAGILLEKMVGFDSDMKKRKEKSEYYTSSLQNSRYKLPIIAPHNVSVYAQYSILCENREDTMNKLKENNVPTAVYYRTPLHLAPAFEYLGYKRGDLPISESVSDRIFSIPIYPEIPRKDQDIVIDNLMKLK